MNRIYHSQVSTVIDGLYSIFKDGYYADKVIQRLLKSNPKQGAKDRAFIANSLYEIVRWWRLIWFLTGDQTELNNNSLYKLFGTYWVWKGNILPDWIEFSDINANEIKNRLKEAEQDFGVLQSIPEWMNMLGCEELGTEKWQVEIKAMNREADIFIRINTLRTTKEQMIALLDETKIPHEVIKDDTIQILKRQNLFQLPVFKKGWFEMQDSGSQLIAPFMQIEPGMRVIDACAGAGGKTLHLASLMKNKGKIIAMDIEAHKLVELKRRAKRAGSSIIETRVIENTKTIKRLKGSADRLLLDVPCSGLGVLKRNPDAKWKLQASFIENLKETQAHIINTYSQMLKPDGLMVYATCSLLKSENEEQVQKFLAEYTDFSLIEEKYAFPSEGNHDGFYMALIKRNI